MPQAASSILILAVTMNFVALGTSSLRACVRAAALQGLFVSLFPLLFSSAPTLRLVGLVLVAGAGRLPELVATSLEQAGRRFRVLAIRGFAERSMRARASMASTSSRALLRSPWLWRRSTMRHWSA